MEDLSLTSWFTNKDDSFRDMPENYDFNDNVKSFENFCGEKFAHGSPVRNQESTQLAPC